MFTLKQTTAHFFVLAAILMAGKISSAEAASICDGLAEGASESLYDSGASLEGIVQAPTQWQVTGCYRGSLFNTRPACQRSNASGGLNGTFGSCATFSGFSTAVAVANALQISMPATFSYLPRNITRVYDNYGNAWDTAMPGNGSFIHILREVTTEMARTLSPDHPKRAKLLNLPNRYAYYGMGQPDRLVGAIASHYNRYASNQRLPAELILDGYVLDREASRYCAVRNSNGYCDEDGADMRAVHSTLLVGRRSYNGVCQALVRNSWNGNCQNGRYARTRRECNAAMDSLWIPETELLAGMSGARIEN